LRNEFVMLKPFTKYSTDETSIGFTTRTPVTITSLIVPSPAAPLKLTGVPVPALTATASRTTVEPSACLRVTL
jgi:hypothetical protein